MNSAVKLSRFYDEKCKNIPVIGAAGSAKFSLIIKIIIIKLNSSA